MQNGQLRFGDVPLRPAKDGTFQLGPQRFKFNVDSSGKLTSMERTVDGEVIRFVAEPTWTPTADELKALAGKWYAEEADAIFTLVVENGQAFLTQRPTTRLQLRPQYKDAFTVNAQPGTVVWFTRENGKVTMHVGTSRLRDMPFVRVGK